MQFSCLDDLLKTNFPVEIVYELKPDLLLAFKQVQIVSGLLLKHSLKTDVYEFLNFRMRDALALVFLFDLLKDLSLISKLPLLLGLVLNSFVEVTWVNLLFLPLTFGESGSRPIILIL